MLVKRLHINLREDGVKNLQKIMQHMETDKQTPAIHHALQLAAMVIDDEIIVTMPGKGEDDE